MEVIDIDLQGHFGHFDSELWEMWLVLCDNSSHIWARITKFAVNMHSGILSVGIENWGHLAIISIQENAFNVAFVY